RSAAFRRSPLGFGGCFHDLAHLDGEFHRKFVEPLMSDASRIAGAMQFLREMKFKRLDQFEKLHPRLTIPTLFLSGADDPTFPERRARSMLPQYPNVAGFESIANAKLFSYEEHPQRVADLIGQFVSGVTNART